MRARCADRGVARDHAHTPRTSNVAAIEPNTQRPTPLRKPSLYLNVSLVFSRNTLTTTEEVSLYASLKNTMASLARSGLGARSSAMRRMPAAPLGLQRPRQQLAAPARVASIGAPTTSSPAPRKDERGFTVKEVRFVFLWLCRAPLRESQCWSLFAAVGPVRLVELRA